MLTLDGGCRTTSRRRRGSAIATALTALMLASWAVRSEAIAVAWLEANGVAYTRRQGSRSDDGA